VLLMVAELVQPWLLREVQRTWRSRGGREPEGGFELVQVRTEMVARRCRCGGKKMVCAAESWWSRTKMVVRELMRGGWRRWCVKAAVGREKKVVTWRNSGGTAAAAWWNSGELTVEGGTRKKNSLHGCCVICGDRKRWWRRRLPWWVEGEEKIRVRVLGDEDDDVAESDWLIWWG